MSPHITYVTVSVDYSDFLGVTIPHNRAHFDDMVVVTAPRDVATQQLCVENHVGLAVTDVFYQQGARFNKGAGLNAGLQLANIRAKAGPLEWVAIMDADTYVPPEVDLRATVDTLDKEWFYGCERTLVPTWEDYQLVLADPARADKELTSPRGFGFGWFQLFHWDSAVIKGCAPGQWYPQSIDCTECDWRMMVKWGNLINDYQDAEGKVGKLPFKAINLGKDGENHGGRISPRFGPVRG